MVHTDWLLRGPEKSVLPSQALWEVNTFFYGSLSFLSDKEPSLQTLDQAIPGL